MTNDPLGLFESDSTNDPLGLFEGESRGQAIPGAEGKEVRSGDKAQYQAPALTASDYVFGLPEVGAAVASGTVAGPLGMGAALAEGALDAVRGRVPDVQKNAEKYAEALSYAPRTEAANRAMEFAAPA